MPSPFPGMDPFLEDAELFPELHDRLIVHIDEAIMAALPQPYYAVTGSRVWIEYARRRIGPDVRIQRRSNGWRGRAASGGGAATLEPPAAKPVIIKIPQDEIREPLVEIYVKEGKKHRLVTSIEVLSPSNKTGGDTGRDLYLQKQVELLAGKVHLVEIDLLRGGEPTTVLRQDPVAAAEHAFDYHICLRRFDQASLWLYPIALTDPLPTINIPLLPGDGEVPLPLQKLFDHVYDRGSFPRVVDYRGQPPPPRLSAAQQRWMRQRLTATRVLKRRSR